MFGGRDSTSQGGQGSIVSEVRVESEEKVMETKKGECFKKEEIVNIPPRYGDFKQDKAERDYWIW